VSFIERLVSKVWNPNPSMKTILVSVIVSLAAVFFDDPRLAGEDTQPADMRLYAAETIEWKAGPAALPAGAKMAVLEGDPAKEGPFVVRFQFPDGYHIAPHTHPKTERVTVISGSLYLAPAGPLIAAAQENFRQDPSVIGLLE
jgi:hypothetical protein